MEMSMSGSMLAVFRGVATVADRHDLEPQTHEFLRNEMWAAYASLGAESIAEADVVESAEALVEAAEREFPGEPLQPMQIQTTLEKICRLLPDLYPWCENGRPTRG